MATQYIAWAGRELPVATIIETTSAETLAERDEAERLLWEAECAAAIWRERADAMLRWAGVAWWLASALDTITYTPGTGAAAELAQMIRDSITAAGYPDPYTDPRLRQWWATIGR